MWYHIKGNKGKVLIGTDQVVPIRDWSLSVESATEDITVKGDDWTEICRLLRSWSGSFSGFFDYTDSGVSAIMDYIFTSEEDYVTLYLYLDDTHYFTGNAILNFSLDNPVDAPVGMTIDFTGSGPLTPVGF